MPMISETELALIQRTAQTEWLDLPGGAKTRVKLWIDGPAPKGTMVLLTGRSEFIEKYFETVFDLRRRGFHVVMMDWRGQGLATRALANSQKGHITDFRQYVGDMKILMDQVVRPRCSAPVSILVHSMGTNITLRWLHDYNDGFIARAVLVAPMLQVKTRPFPPALAGQVVKRATQLGQGHRYIPGGGDLADKDWAFETNHLTHDRDRFESDMGWVRENPDLAISAPTMGWSAAALNSIDVVWRRGYPEAIKVPILIVSARADDLVEPTSHDRYVDRLPLGVLLKVEGARHEVLREADRYRDLFWAGFDEFVDATGPQPAKTARAASYT